MSTLIRDGQTLVYGASGTGPATVVLAHNLMARRGSFAAVAAALAGRARVLSVDLRAHGDSVPTRAGFTVMDLAGDLAAVLDAHPRLQAWYERITAPGHGRFEPMSSADAVDLAARATGNARSAAVGRCDAARRRQR